MSNGTDIKRERHEFLLAYYNMATMDLDRHLKSGWQSIAMIAGAVAAISLGEQGHLPLPIAVSIALIVFGWGMLHIIDANFWSVRAIAFLANVEAIYCTSEDKSVLNPYLGTHPRIKLMNSLRYQLYAFIFFSALTSLYYIAELIEILPDNRMLEWLIASDWLHIFMLGLPIFICFCLVYLILRADQKRVKDYLDFVKRCPGPGLVKTRADLGEARPADIDAGKKISPQQVQQETRADTTRRRKNRNIAVCVCTSVFILISLVLLGAVLAAAFLSPSDIGLN